MSHGKAMHLTSSEVRSGTKNNGGLAASNQVLVNGGQQKPKLIAHKQQKLVNSSSGAPWSDKNTTSSTSFPVAAVSSAQLRCDPVIKDKQRMLNSLKDELR